MLVTIRAAPVAILPLLAARFFGTWRAFRITCPLWEEPAVTDDSPHKGTVMRGLVIFFASQNKLLNKQSICRWFEMPWCSCDFTVIFVLDIFGAPQGWFLPPNAKLRITGNAKNEDIFDLPTSLYGDALCSTGSCITNVIATCRKNFSQWERSFLWKLRCHWLKFLRLVAKTLVIQGPGPLCGEFVCGRLIPLTEAQ